MAEGDGWVWPMRLHPLDGRKPVVSDGFSRWTARRSSGKHLGVDIMYKRSQPAEPKLPERTKWFDCPSGIVEACAVRAGRVWRVNRADPHGVSVELDLGFIPGVGKRVAVYRHLERALVDDGDAITAGQTIGIVGHDRTVAANLTPNHLHFELWDPARIGDPGRETWAIDPEPFMVGWGFVGKDGTFYAPDPPPDRSPAGAELGVDVMAPGGAL